MRPLSACSAFLATLSRSTPLQPRHWVADVIYTPLETTLIKTARAKQASVMGGAGMCVHQAAETFKLFTGLTADIGRMQRTFAEAAAIREKTLEAASSK